MGRKNKNKPIATFVIPKDLIMAKEKPRFNAHQGGTGAFEDKTKYNRKDKHRKDYDKNY